MVLTQGGFDWWWAPIFSTVIYAGSMEFLAVGLIGGAVTPFASLAAATLLINFRHVFYGLSFPLRVIRSRIGRIYSVYALTDESYAIVAPKPHEKLTGPPGSSPCRCCVRWCGSHRGPSVP